MESIGLELRALTHELKRIKEELIKVNTREDTKLEATLEPQP